MIPLLAGLIGLGALSAGTSLITGGLNYAEQKKQNKISNELNQQNLNLQKDSFGYQKDLNKQIMAREDNAVQRRVNDLYASGLSRNLAAGSSAASSPLTSSVGNVGVGRVDAAKFDSSGVTQSLSSIANNLTSAYLSSSQMKLNDINAIVRAKEGGLIDAKTAETMANTAFTKGAKTDYYNAITNEANSRTDKNKAETETINYDRDIAQRTGVSTHEPVTPNTPAAVGWRAGQHLGSISALKDDIKAYIKHSKNSGSEYSPKKYFEAMSKEMKNKFSHSDVAKYFDDIYEELVKEENEAHLKYRRGK